MTQEISVNYSVALQEAIRVLILKKQEELNYKLTLEDASFIVEVLTDTVRLGIHKYIKGAKNYGDNFLSDVDHLGELQPELIDAIFYSKAAQYKYHKLDIRNHE